jgi:acyl carrier protein
VNVELPQVLTWVREFVTQKRGVAADAIQPDTPLLREGCLDSFQLVELIVVLEKRLGETIPDGMLIPEDFETPTTLCERLRDI